MPKEQDDSKVINGRDLSAQEMRYHVAVDSKRKTKDPELKPWHGHIYVYKKNDS